MEFIFHPATGEMIHPKTILTKKFPEAVSIHAERWNHRWYVVQDLGGDNIEILGRGAIEEDAWLDAILTA